MVDVVSHKQHQKNRKSSQQKAGQRQSTPEQHKKCIRCGKNPHSQDACPAKDATCRKCQKKGHFTAMCFTKAIRNVEQDSSALGSFYLDTIQNTQDTNFWTTDVKKIM